LPKHFACSQKIQIHKTYCGDSKKIITPFMQVVNYTTRNFATFRPSVLQPSLTKYSDCFFIKFSLYISI